MKNKNFLTPLILENSYLKSQGLKVSLLTCNTDFFLLRVLKDTPDSFSEGQGPCILFSVVFQGLAQNGHSPDSC